MQDNAEAAKLLAADAARLTDGILIAIRPSVEQQVRLHIGMMAQERVKAILMPLVSGTMQEQHVQASPAQDARKSAFGVSGTSTAGIIEFLKSRGTEGATGTEILDYLRDKHGVEKRDTARKAITRAREMGIIRKEGGRWFLLERQLAEGRVESLEA